MSARKKRSDKTPSGHRHADRPVEKAADRLADKPSHEAVAAEKPASEQAAPPAQAAAPAPEPQPAAKEFVERRAGDRRVGDRRFGDRRVDERRAGDRRGAGAPAGPSGGVSANKRQAGGPPRPALRLERGSWRAAFREFGPGAARLVRYRRPNLGPDALTGLVLAGLLVPQGMAYAQLAGLPPITGLYATLLALLAYALFGPSRFLVLGPDSALSLMIAAAVIPMAAGDATRAVALAATLALMVGAIAIGLGLSRLGFVTDLLSKPVRVGYLGGIAVTIVASQLAPMFGFSVHAGTALRYLAEFAAGLYKAVPAAAVIGLAVMVTVLLIRRFAPRFPGVFIAVLGATLATWALGLASKGVSVVGVLPRGLPSFQLPQLLPTDFVPLLAASAGIALVALADTISTAGSFASRAGEDTFPNQEFVAVGAANLLAGLFGGFPVSGSASRTSVAQQSGARTQLANLVAAGIVVVMLVAAPWLVAYLPLPALAGIVIVAAIALFDRRELANLANVRPSEFGQALVALLGVVALGVLPGLGLAVAVSLVNFLRRAWWPHDAVLGNPPGLAGFHDVKFHPEARQEPGMIIYRFDAPLFFANARAFHDRVMELIATYDGPVRWFVVAAEAITDIEATAAEMLLNLDIDLAARGTRLVFAELKDPVHERMKCYGLDHEIPKGAFFPTVHAAVKAYRHERGLPGDELATLVGSPVADVGEHSGGGSDDDVPRAPSTDRPSR